jgi:hypothetical protein
MDTYATNLKGYNNSNALLQAAWGASKWPRAAELIKYYAQGPAPAPLWAPSHAQAFANMLTNVSVGGVVFAPSTRPHASSWVVEWLGGGGLDVVVGAAARGVGLGGRDGGGGG